MVGGGGDDDGGGGGGGGGGGDDDPIVISSPSPPPTTSEDAELDVGAPSAAKKPKTRGVGELHSTPSAEPPSTTPEQKASFSELLDIMCKAGRQLMKESRAADQKQAEKMRNARPYFSATPRRSQSKPAPQSGGSPVRRSSRLQEAASRMPVYDQVWHKQTWVDRPADSPTRRMDAPLPPLRSSMTDRRQPDANPRRGVDSMLSDWQPNQSYDRTTVARLQRRGQPSLSGGSRQRGGCGVGRGHHNRA